MAVDNVIFPNPKLIHSMKKSSAIPVNIVSNGNTEYRIRTNAFERFSWEWPSSTMTDSQIRTLYQFWVQRGGGLNSFKFQDPDYPNFVDGRLGSAGTTTWFLRVPFDSTTPGQHRVFNLDLANTTCKKNGTTATISSASINANGEPIITVAGSSPSDVIAISGPIYFTARFDSSVEWVLEALDFDNLPVISTYSNIKLIEVFESTL